MPMPVKPKEQQPLTSHADGAQKSTVSIKSNRELQPMKLKQQYAKVQPMVTKSLSRQVIPDKISQKRTISSDQCVIIRPGMHNQGRHDVPKQLVAVSSKSARKNEKQSWQKKSQTSEKKVLSEVKYSQEFPVSYKVIVLYCTV